MSIEQTLIYAIIINPFINFIVQIVTFIKDIFIVSIRIDRDSRYYACMDLFLSKQTLISATNILLNNRNSFVNKAFYQYNSNKDKCINDGKHVYWYRNRLIFVIKEKEDLISFAANSYFHIYIPFGTKNMINVILEEIMECEKGNKHFYKHYYYVNEHHHYLSHTYRLKISENSIILPSKIKETVINWVQEFIDNKKWYNKMSIQYKLGLLFEGISGSGKSSLVFLLASKFELPVIYLPIEYIESSSLIIREDRFICLIEDIDRTPKIANNEEKSIKEKEDNKFSNILQLLDGINTPDGCIFILTSNKTRELDPALIRPGRIDHIIQFEAARKEEARKLFLMFFPNEDDACEDFIKNIEFIDTLSMAALKSHLTEHKNDIVKAKEYVN